MLDGEMVIGNDGGATPAATPVHQDLAPPEPLRFSGKQSCASEAPGGSKTCCSADNGCGKNRWVVTSNDTHALLLDDSSIRLIVNDYCCSASQLCRTRWQRPSRAKTTSEAKAIGSRDEAPHGQPNPGRNPKRSRADQSHGAGTLLVVIWIVFTGE